MSTEDEENRDNTDEDVDVVAGEHKRITHLVYNYQVRVLCSYGWLQKVMAQTTGTTCLLKVLI